MKKTFTLDEAKTLLPVLGALLLKARASAVRAGVLENDMQALSQRIFLMGGLHVDVAAAAHRRAEREKALQDARTTIEEISEIGVQVAEVEHGGLEFPYLLEGKLVLLSWALGEDEIGFWREENDAADARRVLDSRFVAKRERERPN